jgi:hypothetical protein
MLNRTFKPSFNHLISVPERSERTRRANFNRRVLRNRCPTHPVRGLPAGNDPEAGLRLVPAHLVQARLVRRRCAQGGGINPERCNGGHAQLHNCAND